MANETKETLKLDLDNAQFIKDILETKGLVVGAFDVKNMEGMLQGLKSASMLLGAVGIAALAAKTALDLTVEGEQIRQINYQFENLTKNAGIATDTLKDGLIDVADGLVDDTDLLKSANKAIVQMGKNAEKLPQLFELSRKATAGFGGDLMQNFEDINRAIATGQTRFLKQIGLSVDAEKAMKNYALSVGKTVKSLTDQERQQAILNEVLAKGEKNFKGINTGITEAGNTWQQLKVTVGQLNELFILFFEKTIGPGVRTALGLLRDFAIATKNALEVGSGTVAQETEKELKRWQEIKKTFQAGFAEAPQGSEKEAFFTKQIDMADKKVTELKAKLAGIKGEKAEAPVALDASEQEKEARDKSREQESQFQKDLLRMRNERVRAQEESAMSEEQAEAAHYERVGLMAQEYQQKRDEIELQYSEKGMITKQQRDQMIEELEMTHAAKMAQINEDLEQKKIDAYERGAKRATGAMEQIGMGMTLASMKAQKEWGNMAKVGERSFNTLAKKGGDAFIAMGEGAQDGGDIMKGFMFGALAEIAEAEGRFMLASAIINPARGAAGAALLVLAGVFRGMAKSAKSIGGSEGAGGAGSTPGPSYSAGSVEEKPDEERLQKKAVNVNFNGDIFETDQTKQRIMEMMREFSDATDYRYNQIGVR